MGKKRERECVCGGEDTTKQESLMLSQRVTLNWAGEVAQPRVLKPGILSAILGTVCVVGGETGSLQAVLCSPHMYSTIHFLKIPLKSWTASLEISRGLLQPLSSQYAQVREDGVGRKSRDLNQVWLKWVSRIFLTSALSSNILRA